MTREIEVVGLAGSLRPGSLTERAVLVALGGAREVGAATRLLPLREYDLPFCDARDDEETYPAGVARMRQDVQRAHGIILGTPEYHGGMSGVLKNALDLMGFEEFEGKMVGLVGVSGGTLGAQGPLAELRTVGRVLHAWVVPEQALIPRAGRAFDDAGRLADARLDERLRTVGRQVARFAYLHTSEGALDFLREWERATPNPGG